VDDAVRALMHICEDVRPACGGPRRYEVYHLGVPAFCVVRDSARWIASEMGVDPAFEFGAGNRGWIGDSPFVLLDVGKAMRTGWTPERPIEPSIRETVRWLLANQWIFAARDDPPR
jgi:UDP-glucose 4-epimerase